MIRLALSLFVAAWSGLWFLPAWLVGSAVSAASAGWKCGRGRPASVEDVDRWDS